MKTLRCILLLLPVLLVSACREEGAGPGGAAPPGPATAAEPKAFQAPGDGKLTAAQVEMYVAVRKKALERAPAPPAKPGEIDAARLAAAVTADREAARELGYSREEYEWVKGRILEARPTTANVAVPPELAQAVHAATLEGLKRLREGSEDPEAVARLEEQIADMEAAQDDRGGESGAEKSEARAFNEELLSRYAEELESLE